MAFAVPPSPHQVNRMSNSPADPGLSSSVAHVDEIPIPFHSRLNAPTALSDAQRAALQSQCVLFTRGVNANMTRWLGSTFTASLSGIERIPFYEIIHSPAAETSFLATLVVGSAGHPALLQMELPLVYHFVELLLGGPGGTLLRREPTEIEGAIVLSVVELICRDLSTAWSSPELEIRHDRALAGRSLDRLMPAVDSTLVLTFDVVCGSQRGTISLTFSSEVAKVLIRSIDGPLETARYSTPQTREAMLQRLQRTMHQITLHLPRTRISVEAIRKLTPGEVLGLDLFEDTPAILSIAGRPAFYATPVDTMSRRGAYITSVIE
jgi:flagellar motor switch protein FliM